MNIKFSKPPISITNNIPRFVVIGSDYTTNFGFQWNLFKKSQMDSQNSGKTMSQSRFFEQTQWNEEDLTNINILEAGSGAGRFSEIVLNYTKANLYSFDYSNAVEANYENNKEFKDRFCLFQASIYEIPFEPNQFDKTFCFGVLQHTPDFKQSVYALCDTLKINGELIIDFYHIKGWWTKINAKYILRPFIKHWSNEKLLNKIEKNVDWMIKLSHFLHKIKLGVLNRFIPIVDIYNTLPVNKVDAKKLRELCVLDTFDMFSPEYDNPQKISVVKKWLEEYNMQVNFAGFINGAAVIRAIKNDSEKV